MIAAVPSRKIVVLALAVALAATVGCTSAAGDAPQPHAQAAESSSAHRRADAVHAPIEADGVERASSDAASNNETGGMMDRFLAIGDRMAGRVFRNRADSRDDDSQDDSADLRTAAAAKTASNAEKSTLTCRRRNGTTYKAYHGSADNVLGGLNLVFEAEANPLCQRREFVCSGSNTPIDYQFFVESTLRRGSSPKGAAGGRRVLLDWYAEGGGDDEEMEKGDLSFDDVEDSFDVVDEAQSETRVLAASGSKGGQGRNAGQSTSNLADALVLSKNHPACLAPEIVCAKDEDDFAVVRTYGQSTGGNDDSEDADSEEDSRDSKGRYNYLSSWRKRANNNRHLQADSSKGTAGGDPITGQSSNTVVIDMADYDLSGRWKKVLSSTNSRCQTKDVVYRCPRDRANMPYRGKRGGFLRDMITCNAAKQDKVKNNTKRKKQNQGLSSTEVGAGYGSGYYNNYNKYEGGGGGGGGKGKGKGGYIQSYHSSTSSRSRSSKGTKGTRRHLEEETSPSWVPGSYTTRRRARDVEVKSLPIGHQACRVKTRVVYRCRGDRDRTRLRRRDGTALRDVTVSFADLRCGYGRRRSGSNRFLQQMRKKRVDGRADDPNRPLAGMRRKKQNKRCPNRSVLGKCETKPG